MMLAANPKDIRKAASFVEAIAKAEDNFDLDLALPAGGLRFNFPGVDPERDGSYVIVRAPNDELALGMIPASSEPRFPIAGRS